MNKLWFRKYFYKSKTNRCMWFFRILQIKKLPFPGRISWTSVIGCVIYQKWRSIGLKIPFNVWTWIKIDDDCCEVCESMRKSTKKLIKFKIDWDLLRIRKLAKVLNFSIYQKSTKSFSSVTTGWSPFKVILNNQNFLPVSYRMIYFFKNQNQNTMHVAVPIA